MLIMRMSRLRCDIIDDDRYRAGHFGVCSGGMEAKELNPALTLTFALQRDQCQTLSVSVLEQSEYHATKA